MGGGKPRDYSYAYCTSGVGLGLGLGYPTDCFAGRSGLRSGAHLYHMLSMSVGSSSPDRYTAMGVYGVKSIDVPFRATNPNILHPLYLGPLKGT